MRFLELNYGLIQSVLIVENEFVVNLLIFTNFVHRFLDCFVARLWQIYRFDLIDRLYDNFERNCGFKVVYSSVSIHIMSSS